MVRALGCLLLLVGMFVLPQLADAASLSASPGTGVYTTGSTFSVRLMLNTQGQAINAAEGSLKFNPNELSVVSLNQAGSIFNLWTVEPTFSNSAGTITFGGGSPSGYSGSNGTILTINFRAKGSGPVKVSFGSGSVLAADGLGTNILDSMNGGSYTISAQQTAPQPEEIIEYVPRANTPGAPVITSSTHGDADAWYKIKTAELSWNVPAGVTAVRTLLDGTPSSIPTKVYDDPISAISLDLDEGVSYFHLQFKNNDGWGRVSHYRLAVDTKHPSQFTISLPENADLSDPVQTLLLDVVESESSVSHFLVQIDGGEPYRTEFESASNTIKLPSLEPGYHTVIIEAFDQAGNSIVQTFSFTILSFDRPRFTEYPSKITAETIPVIKGVTRPASEVTITVSKLGGTTKDQYIVSSNETGEFIFIPDDRLELGVYELSAVAVDQHGAKSELSEPVRIAVEQPGYLRFGSLVVSVLSVIVPLIAIILLLVIAVLYFFNRIRRITGFVRKETTEALDVLDKEFSQVQGTIDEEAAVLAESRKSKQLTKSEHELIKKIKVRLDIARTNVRREVGEVDDIVE